MLAFLFLFTSFYSQADFGSMCTHYPDSDPPYGQVLRCRKLGYTLYVDGGIDPYLYEEIQHWDNPYYFKEGQGDVLKKISLNSRGGLMFSGSEHIYDTKALMDLVEQKELDTEVRAAKLCKSACVPLFSAGKSRKAHASALFMVHSPRMSSSSLFRFRKKCGKRLQKKECQAELSQIREKQLQQMDLYFALMEERGVSLQLRQDYLKMEKDPDEVLKGNLIGLKDYNFSGLKALEYGLVHELLN